MFFILPSVSFCFTLPMSRIDLHTRETCTTKEKVYYVEIWVGDGRVMLGEGTVADGMSRGTAIVSFSYSKHPANTLDHVKP